jgi:outer membrane receptor protein involved in Fe transport
MDQLSFFIFDQFRIASRLNITASLHYTLAKLSYASFSIENNSGSSDLLLPFEGDTSGQNWQKLSPRIALNYSHSGFNIYASYSGGFRPPTLDDLTRSGFIAGAFKIANPALKPEFANTLELGASFQRNSLRLSISGFYTLGNDFLAYVETGETMGRRPIVQKENISKVSITGAEFAINWKTSRHLELIGNLTYNASNILSYEGKPELEGNSLTYTPELMANLGMVVHTKYLNGSAYLKYTSLQYIDDSNTQTIPDVTLLNMKIWYDFNFGLHLAVSGENLLDQRYLIYYDQMSIGRFLSATVGYHF